MIFKNLRINNIKLKNRVAVGPMCQYSAINGKPSEWHYHHLHRLSQLGSGLLILESTFPCHDAKISKNDLVLSNNLEKKIFINLINYIRIHSKIPLGFQLSHAGRKGSSHVPWYKFNTALTKKEGAWKTFAPMSNKRDISLPLPFEFQTIDNNKIKKKMIHSSFLANEAGFDL